MKRTYKYKNKNLEITDIECPECHIRLTYSQYELGTCDNCGWIVENLKDQMNWFGNDIETRKSFQRRSGLK